MQRKICVFGSSSKKTPKSYMDASRKLGRLIAESGNICVNGAGRFGVMGGMNEGCKDAGGDIIGVIHHRFCVDFENHPIISNLIRVGGEDLTERKDQLFANADCIMIMPGGAGTFDEFWEAVSCKVLGLKRLPGMPICVVNIDGFYDGTIQQLKRAHEDNLLYGELEEYFHYEDTVESALNWCLIEMENRIDYSKDAVDLDSGPLSTHPSKGKFDRILAHSTTLGDNEGDEVKPVGSSKKEACVKSSKTSFSSDSSSSGGSSYGQIVWVSCVIVAAAAGFFVGRTVSTAAR